MSPNPSHALPSPFLQNADNALPFLTRKSQLSSSTAPPSPTPPFSSSIFVDPTVWLSLQSSSILIQNLLLSNPSPLPNANLWVSSSGFQNLGLILSIILSKVLAQTADSSKEGNSFLSLRLNLLVQIASDIYETF